MNCRGAVIGTAAGTVTTTSTGPFPCVGEIAVMCVLLTNELDAVTPSNVTVASIVKPVVPPPMASTWTSVP